MSRTEACARWQASSQQPHPAVQWLAGTLQQLLGDEPGEQVRAMCSCGGDRRRLVSEERQHTHELCVQGQDLRGMLQSLECSSNQAQGRLEAGLSQAASEAQELVQACIASAGGMSGCRLGLAALWARPASSRDGSPRLMSGAGCLAAGHEQSSWRKQHSNSLQQRRLAEVSVRLRCSVHALHVSPEA